MKWPPNSPDLSPIENAWSKVTAELNKKHYKSFDTFIVGLRREWREMSTDYLRSLI